MKSPNVSAGKWSLQTFVALISVLSALLGVGGMTGVVSNQITHLRKTGMRDFVPQSTVSPLRVVPSFSVWLCAVSAFVLVPAAQPKMSWRLQSEQERKNTAEDSASEISFG